MDQQEIHDCYICKCVRIYHNKTSKPVDMPSNHYHDAYELYYLISGEQYFFVKDRTYSIKAGDLVFINTGDLHKIIPAGSPEHESITINFSEQFFNYFTEDILELGLSIPLQHYRTVIHVKGDNQKIVEDIFRRTLEECICKKQGYILSIKILMMELLIFLIRTSEDMPELDSPHPSAVHSKISDIVCYINSHYTQNITLTSLSQEFNISPYYLSRTFKLVTGFSFTEYLNTIRTKKAQELLKETHLNITQIAEEIGYCNINQFGRIFKSITGVPPSDFRRTENL